VAPDDVKKTSIFEISRIGELRKVFNMRKSATSDMDMPKLPSLFEALNVIRNTIPFFNSNTGCPIPFLCDLVVSAWTSGDLACVKAGILMHVAILRNCKHFSGISHDFLLGGVASMCG
jgi:hypothetical protein